MKTFLVTFRIAAALLVTAILAPAFGATVDVTFHNDSSSLLIVRNLSVGGSFNVATGEHSVSLNDLHSFSVAPFNVGGDPGHQFSFSGGLVVAGGNAPVTNDYFHVDTTNIFVSGIKFTARLVTDVVGNGFQNLFGNFGFAVPNGFAILNGADYVASLLPSDGNYNGTYDMQFTAPAANPVTMVISRDGVLGFSGVGTSYVSSGPNSILATLSNGNVLELTAIPEPSSMALLGLGGILWAWRRKNAAE